MCGTSERHDPLDEAIVAFVGNQRLDRLAANHLARALFSEIYAVPTRPVDGARFVLLDPRAEGFYYDWHRVADARSTPIGRCHGVCKRVCQINGGSGLVVRLILSPKALANAFSIGFRLGPPGPASAAGIERPGQKVEALQSGRVVGAPEASWPRNGTNSVQVFSNRRMIAG